MSNSIVLFLRRLRPTEYARIPSGSDSTEKLPTIQTYRKGPTWPSQLLIVLFCLLAAAGGFVLGFRLQSNRDTLPAWAHSMPRAQIGLLQQTWEYDKTFGAQPPTDNSTEAEWDALIPKGQGFVRYPADSPHASAVSAVHQLHCLYSIRRALFAKPGVPIAGINMEHLQPPHMRHCFDYLRQALLCSADSTLEPFRPELGGVTGWGFPRVCRNYAELKEWAESKRTNDQEGFVEIVSHPHPMQGSTKEHM